MRNPYWRTRLEHTPYMTYAILGVTIIVFILETFAGGSTNPGVLYDYGARWNNAIILLNQWWRLFTPMFVHIGFMHILMNGFALYFLGQLTEQVVGHWRFLVIYLVSGIVGNVASFAFNIDGLTAGASTAIFGLMGAFLFYGDTYRHNPVIATLARNFVTLAGINLFFNLFSNSVDIAGHIGGFLGGVLIAGVLGAPKLGDYPVERKIMLGVVLVVALAAMIAFGRSQTISLLRMRGL